MERNSLKFSEVSGLPLFKILLTLLIFSIKLRGSRNLIAMQEYFNRQATFYRKIQSYFQFYNLNFKANSIM